MALQDLEEGHSRMFRCLSSSFHDLLSVLYYMHEVITICFSDVFLIFINHIFDIQQYGTLVNGNAGQKLNIDVIMQFFAEYMERFITLNEQWQAGQKFCMHFSKQQNVLKHVHMHRPWQVWLFSTAAPVRGSHLLPLNTHIQLLIPAKRLTTRQRNEKRPSREGKGNERIIDAGVWSQD